MLKVKRMGESPRTIANPEIIEHILHPGGVASLTGASGTGKTFVCLDMASHLSAGTKWMNLHTEKGSVLYIHYEGILDSREAALVKAKRNCDNFYYAQGFNPLNMRTNEDQSQGEKDLLTAVRSLVFQLKKGEKPPLRMIIIDTVSASLVGDENSSSQIADYLRAIRRVQAQEAPLAGTLLIHHTGWQDGESPKLRERGSSALRGNVDVSLLLKSGGGPVGEKAPLQLLWQKVRESKQPAPRYMFLVPIELDYKDHWGNMENSCIIEPDTRTARERRLAALKDKAKKDGGMKDAVLKAILGGTFTNQKDLATEVGKSPNAVSTFLAEAIGAKWIEKVEGAYRVTPLGKKELDVFIDSWNTEG